MTKENVIATREALRANNKCGVKIICDNMILVDESNEIVIWDDANEKVKVIRPNPNALSRLDTNIQVIEFEYEMIQYMTASFDINILKTYTDKLVSDGLCSEDQAKGILRWANDFNIEPKPLIEPTTDNSQEEPEEEGSGDNMVEE